MKLSSGRWPSLGFCAVCLTYLLTAAFFAWGFSAPLLERAWLLHHQLKIGKIDRLRPAQRKLLESCLQRYPQVTEDWLAGKAEGMLSANSDGWMATPSAVLLRTPASRIAELMLDIQTPADLMPYRLVVRGRDWKRRIEIERPGSVRVELPPPSGPEIIEVRLRGRKFESDPSLLGVRVGWGSGA